MSTTRQELLNANNPVRADSATSELNSLAVNGVTLCAVVVSNVQGDSQGQGYPDVKGKLSLGSLTPVSNGAIYVWLLQADDGTNYETYNTAATNTAQPCARPPDFVFALDPVAGAVVRDAWASQGAPVCAKMKALVWNQAGVALAASGNSLNLYFSTDQMN